MNQTLKSRSDKWSRITRGDPDSNCLCLYAHCCDQFCNVDECVYVCTCMYENVISYNDRYNNVCTGDYVLYGIGRQRAKCGFYQTVFYEFSVCDIHLYVISPVYVTGFLLSKYIPQYDLAYCSNG